MSDRGSRSSSSTAVVGGERKSSSFSSFGSAFGGAVSAGTDVDVD